MATVLPGNRGGGGGGPPQQRSGVGGGAGGGGGGRRGGNTPIAGGGGGPRRAQARQTNDKEFSICAQEVAELLRERFTGWLYSVDSDGPVTGVTCKNPALDRDLTTPHAQIERAIRKNKDAMGIVRISDGTKGSNAIIKFFTQLYNGRAWHIQRLARF